MAQFARSVASDWGVGRVLVPLDLVKGIDQRRYLADLAANVLASAKPMTMLRQRRADLLYKQAGLSEHEYDKLVRMFGPPQKTIFCVREPEGYIASAVNKFPHFQLDELQSMYCRMFEEYKKIGGAILNYGPELSNETLRAFFAFLPMDETMVPFEYKGKKRPDLVTPQMRSAFEDFRSEFCPGLFKIDPSTEG